MARRVTSLIGTSRRHDLRPELVRRSRNTFREFNRRDPESLDRIEIDLSHPLVRIGEVPEIHYISDKEGSPTHYRHEVDKPGVLYAHPRGKFFLLVGGSTKVRDWLIDPSDNPRSVLSRSNIERAIESYRRLSPAKRAEIDDVQAYLAATAWQIQRRRLRKYRHR